MALLSDIALSRRPMAAFVVIGLAWGAFAGMVPPVKAQIGASDSLYGGLLLIASFGAIAAMWLAPVTQAIAGRWAMVIASLMVGLGFALVAQTAGFVAFTLALLVVTTGTGVADVLANAELADREAQSGRALMNLNHGVYSFSFAGGAVVTGLLRGIGWGPVGITAVLLVTVVALCLLMHAPKAAPPAADEDEKSDAPLPALLVWLGGGVVLAAFLSEAATEGWSALHLERTLGAEAAFGALAPALFGLTMGIGRLSGHMLTGRIPDLLLMTSACLMAASGLVVAGLAPTLVVAYLGFACAGLGISVVVPLAFALIGRSVPEELRLTAIARSAAMGYSAFFLGPPIMGGIAEVFGLRMSFLFISALLVVVALVLLPALGRQVVNKG